MTQKTSSIFSPLTTEQETLMLGKVDTTYKCPICACGRTVRKNIGEMLRQTKTPDEIWRELRNDGYAPKLKNNDINSFKKVIDTHIAFCLRENFVEYRIALKERKTNEKLSKELEEEVRSRGIQVSTTETHINYGELVKQNKEIVKPKEFKSEMSELIPAIILNNLRALKFEQEKYLRGERSHPPDLKAIDTVLRSLKALIGSAEIAEFMRED